MQSADWYIVARIAEAHGLNDAVREAYGRVTGKPGPTTFSLAQLRLQKLGVAK
jgi:hypothetical protein